MSSLADTIHGIAFFSGLSREDLARIAGKLEEERFSLGGVIVKQGEAGDSLYVVQTGAVEVLLQNDGLGAESLAVLGPNESFGEMALFTGERRSATVRALVDSVVLKLSKENWEELLAKHPSLSFHFCKVLSRRLAETNKDISKGPGGFYPGHGGVLFRSECPSTRLSDPELCFEELGAGGDSIGPVGL